jgi:hypothetical protein
MGLNKCHKDSMWMWGQIQSITTCSKIAIQYSYDVYNDIKVKDYIYKILYGYYTKIIKNKAHYRKFLNMISLL